MPRPTTKQDLLNVATDSFVRLHKTIESMTQEELSTSFAFENDSKKKEAHWKRDKNLRDILIHLYEWHLLAITWVRVNQKGQTQSFLPTPYNWRTYGDMNIELWNKHQNTSLEEAKEQLLKTHEEGAVTTR